MFNRRKNRSLPPEPDKTAELQATITALEKELADTKAELELLKKRIAAQPAKKPTPPPPPPPKKPQPTPKPLPPIHRDSVFFDMKEYFCGGHDDTAVDVIEYDRNGKVLATTTYSRNSGCGETTPDGIWAKAKEHADRLAQNEIPLRRQYRIGDKTQYDPTMNPIPQATEEERRQYQAVDDQPLGPFFPKDGPVLVDSLGSWEQDVAEAQRRMDLFFSTAEVFSNARKRGQETDCRGRWASKLHYGYTFWSREYYHYHDGLDVEGESVSIIRIRPDEFHSPHDPSHFRNRILALEGLQKNDFPLNWKKNINLAKSWNVPKGLEKLEEQRYYLKYSRFRAKNFLGMIGYFEIRWESY